MAPDAGLPAHQVTDGELLYVEQGTLTIADGLGLSSPLSAENSVHLRAGSSFTLINDGDGDVSFLRLSIVTYGTSATPIAAIPVAENSESSDGAEITVLAAYDLSTIPVSPTTFFLSRATWGAGVDSGEYTQNGPIGMLTESGTLTISSPSGIDGQLGEGKAVLLPADQVLRTRNDGASDAVALLFGVVPTDGGMVTSSASAPELDVDPTDLEDLSESPTTPSGVLYQADASTGFDDWSNAGGWVTVSGMLVNDGSSDKPIFTAAPIEVPGSDYAIEVEIQWARDGETFGVVARGEDDGGYWAGFGDVNCYDFWELALWAGPANLGGGCGLDASNIISKSDVKLDTDWHTYRIEVQGNIIRVFLDGTKILDTTDNRSLTSGQVGVWSDGAQVNVRRFTVISLAGG